jgi:acetyl-CoA synthetase
MAAAVSLPHPTKGESIAVYVVAATGIEQGPELAARVADAVAESLGRPFRPSRVEFVEDLPRTRSAKIMRRVIRALALGQDPGDLTSLENPGSLEGFATLDLD